MFQGTFPRKYSIKTWKFITEILNKKKRNRISTVNNSVRTPLIGNNMGNYFNKYFVSMVSSIISHTTKIHLLILCKHGLINNIS